MKVEELRIGNYVNYNKTEYRILSLSKKSIKGLSRKWLGNELLGKDLECYPIPLTEEWLLKFGFDVLKKPKWCTNGHLELHIYKNISYFYKNSSPPVFIKYVHQLQNLYFALTYKELKIKELCS